MEFKVFGIPLDCLGMSEEFLSNPNNVLRMLEIIMIAKEFIRISWEFLRTHTNPFDFPKDSVRTSEESLIIPKTIIKI